MITKNAMNTCSLKLNQTKINGESNTTNQKVARSSRAGCIN